MTWLTIAVRGEDAALAFRFAFREVEQLESAKGEAELETLRPLPITSSRMAQRAAPEGRRRRPSRLREPDRQNVVGAGASSAGDADAGEQGHHLQA